MNGKPLGKAERDAVNVCRWENVELQAGPNRIEATGQADGKTVADQCEWIVEQAASSPAQPAPATSPAILPPKQ